MHRTHYRRSAGPTCSARNLSVQTLPSNAAKNFQTGIEEIREIGEFVNGKLKIVKIAKIRKFFLMKFAVAVCSKKLCHSEKLWCYVFYDQKTNTRLQWRKECTEHGELFFLTQFIIKFPKSIDLKRFPVKYSRCIEMKLKCKILLTNNIL